MMRTFEYKGPAGNLGRFGFVNPGDLLVLSDREAEDIANDKQFKPVVADVPKEAVESAAWVSIAQMDRAELLEYCASVKAIDPTFEFSPMWETPRLVRAIGMRMEYKNEN